MQSPWDWYERLPPHTHCKMSIIDTPPSNDRHKSWWRTFDHAFGTLNSLIVWCLSVCLWLSPYAMLNLEIKLQRDTPLKYYLKNSFDFKRGWNESKESLCVLSYHLDQLWIGNQFPTSQLRSTTRQQCRVPTSWLTNFPDFPFQHFPHFPAFFNGLFPMQ